MYSSFCNTHVSTSFLRSTVASRSIFGDNAAKVDLLDSSILPELFMLYTRNDSNIFEVEISSWNFGRYRPSCLAPSGFIVDK